MLFTYLPSKITYEISNFAIFVFFGFYGFHGFCGFCGFFGREGKKERPEVELDRGLKEVGGYLLKEGCS